MNYRLKSLTVLFAIGTVGLSLAHGADHRFSPRREVIEVRLIASEPSLPGTSFGPNLTSYVAEMRTRNEPPQLVRLVYSHFFSAPPPPKSFLDYAMVHRFGALRDEGCDLPLASMLYSYRFSSSANGPTHLIGRELTLNYASTAPRELEQDDKILPCYVVRQKDYKGSHASNVAEKHWRKTAEGL
jgi:hypothetical protein